jgi:SAM-dependent methyltransferase
MARKLRRKVARSSRSAEVVEARAERLPLGDESVDTAVGTVVLCTTPGPAAVLAEVARVLLLGIISSSTRYADLWPALTLLGLGSSVALTPMNLAALNSTPRRNHGAVGGIVATVAGVGNTLGVALSGAVFEQLQTVRTVSAARDRGVHISADAARTLEGLLPGTPDATRALSTYPAGHRAALTDSVHVGFISALARTMILSLAFVVVGIVLALLPIRRYPALEPLRPPNVADPFSGLSPRR